MVGYVLTELHGSTVVWVYSSSEAIETVLGQYYGQNSSTISRREIDEMEASRTEFWSRWRADSKEKGTERTTTFNLGAIVSQN